MLDWVQIGRIRRPIFDLCNPILLKLIAYFDCSMNRSIILHKDIARVQRLNCWFNLYVKNLQIRVSGVSMFLRLEISVYNIKVSLPIIPKASPDYNFHILMAIVGLNHRFIPHLVSSSEHPFGLFSPPPLY